MVNEEIVTGLRNAIEHGDSLQDAMQIMMNSGYSPQEVQEASRYVGGGTLHMQQPTPEEHLAMPSQKSAMQKMAFWKGQKPQSQQFQQPVQAQQQVKPINQSQQPIQQNQFQQQRQPMQSLPPSQSQQIQQAQQQEQFSVQQSYEPKVQESVPLAKQLNKIKPPRTSHLKEIVLLIILLVLIGLLVATIMFKSTILGWFS
ncbi:MAG: hypothetical protein PHH54_04720 [Candidatus Nanoarchaeia archaeon]|nr:hypothetical protein [Candidatus Nanoarchaeia archaeon]MDD5741260.1 hypothetical protein [Candidatus Nanoarchaeia archaeon]